MKFLRFLFSLALVVQCAGCVGQLGKVESGMLMPNFGSPVEIAENQRFLFPTPVVRLEDPVFPATELSIRGRRAVVCLEFVVDEHGGVASVKPMGETPECPQAPDRDSPFASAAMDAVSKWQFLAGAICTFPDGAVQDETCSGEGVDMQLVPVRLAYRFEFRVVDGKGHVRSARSGPGT